MKRVKAETYRNDYQSVCSEISKMITKRYSTSFYWASLFFDKEIQKGIFNIYGFVRFADEIVDTFHEFDKVKLLSEFEEEYRKGLETGISLNPIIFSFIQTCKQYKVDAKHVDAFLQSMRYDLTKKEYSKREDINEYIYGSAEVIGLMCLKIFCKGNQTQYDQLEHFAIKLGAAFQKVNFIRDLKNDTQELNRIYFPEIVGAVFDNEIKKRIIEDIEKDFYEAKKGIKKLPRGSKLAVYIAFIYYKELLNKIKKSDAETILTTRIRVPNYYKLLLIFRAIFENTFFL
ncbi:MAG TPA: phytoene/squalene synthase family protein [Bacteroidales bacterium]|nr:phytoene/squalene synthase family protein [Bacteroidales bacterium]